MGALVAPFFSPIKASILSRACARFHPLWRALEHLQPRLIARTTFGHKRTVPVTFRFSCVNQPIFVLNHERAPGPARWRSPDAGNQQG